MKRILSLSLIITLIISFLTVFSYASDVNSYTFYYNDREITIEAESINEDEAHAIADYIAYGIVPAGFVEPGNMINTPLLCILFGHSIETYTAKEVIHNVYTTSPKCVRNLYSVEVCTRESCDYMQSTLISSQRISTCHG